MIFKDMDRIVFVGDSVTDMGRTFPVGEGASDSTGHGYVRMIQNLILTCYPELRLRLTNMGVDGNTSRDLLARFEQDVTALSPDWVSICIGINDVWRQFDWPAMADRQVQPEEYQSNLEAMLNALQGQVKGTILMSPYYMEPLRSDPMRARMDQYGQICRQLAETYGCIFVDLQEAFDRYLRYQHSCFLAWDRVHPNQIGATIIAKAFLDRCGFVYDRLPGT